MLLALNDTCLVGTASQRAGRWAKRWLGWDWGHDTADENNGWGTGWGGDWGGEQGQDEQGSQVGQPPADSQGGEEGGAGQQDNSAAVGLMLTCALGTGQVSGQGPFERRRSFGSMLGERWVLLGSCTINHHSCLGVHALGCGLLVQGCATH